MTGDRKPSAEDMDAAIAALSQHGDPLRPYQVEAVAKAIAERVNREVERRREAEALVSELASALTDEGPDWSDQGLERLRRRVCVIFPGDYPYWETLLDIPYPKTSGER